MELASSEELETAVNDGVTLAYSRSGRQDAETVVFVEGLGYSRWMWNWQRAALEEEFDIIVLDNRGTGDSDEPEGPYTMGQMAGDLEAVLDAAGVETAHVVGASMGGMIAMQYALEYDRAQSLVLMCTSFGGEEAVPIPEETEHKMFNVPEGYNEREAIRHKMGPAMSPSFPERNPDIVEQIIDWRLESDASDQARGWQAAAVGAFDVSDRLDEIRIPTLVMHGTADRVIPVENSQMLVERLPNDEYEPVEDGPHLFFIESADLVTVRIRQFLDDV